MPPVRDLDPLDLLGTWDLSRIIIDRKANDKSGVIGVTELAVLSDGRIQWTESGTLTRHGTDVPVSRVLYLEQRAGGWYVTFDDGRDFHPWQPGSPVEHDCSPDLYVGMVERLDADRWSVEWQVTGPSKDYTMTSVLTRSKPTP